MSDELNLPIRPSDPSLQSHLQALDLLSAQIGRLTERTRWQARIPLNTKASIQGEVIHTNELKVHVGDGWYIEMTAQEAVAYVHRRKQALLLDHVRMEQGVFSRQSEAGPSRLAIQDKRSLPPTIHLNQVFPSPIGSHLSALDNAQVVQEVPSADYTSQSRASEAVESVLQGRSQDASADHAAADEKEALTLDNLVEGFLSRQKELADASGGRQIPTANQEEITLNEEGLPFHEIREAPDGSVIGAMPPPTISSIPDVKTEDEQDSYWSDEAVARRAALRKSIFQQDSDSDEDDEDEVEQAVKGGPSPALDSTVTPVPQQAHTTSPIPTSASLPKSPSPPPTVIPKETSPEPAVSLSRRSSLSSGQPKSILKTGSRKKSVSFDESVPLPPDSPPQATKAIGGVDFPLPSKQVGGEFEPRPVPVIAEPKPAVKSAVKEKSSTGFGGFKRGFLTPPKPSPLGPNSQSSAGNSTAIASTSIKESSQVSQPEAGTSKPPSLFAQRRAMQGQVAQSSQAAGSGSRTGATQPAKSLPKMSQAKPMGFMKGSVVERIPEDRPSRTRPAHSSSRSPLITSTVVESDMEDDEAGVDFSIGGAISEHAEYPEDDEEGDDEEEEDEYDLDEALLAREVALEYHRRQAYASKLQRDDEESANLDLAMMSDGEGEDGEEGAGGVMMGLPQIAANGMIVNPTPEDLRKFVRVGRLENGNLVLAPGEEAWSDEEDPESKAKIEAVKQQLLQPNPLSTSASKDQANPQDAPKFGRRLPNPTTSSKPVVENVGLPPTVRTEESEETPPMAAEPAEPVAFAPTPAKKVSRFKAARTGA